MRRLGRQAIDMVQEASYQSDLNRTEWTGRMATWVLIAATTNVGTLLVIRNNLLGGPHIVAECVSPGMP